MNEDRFPHLPAAEMKSLFEEVKKFHRLEPWHDIDGDELFGVEDANTGQRFYCSIMGRLGSFYALNVYPNADAVRSYTRILTMNEHSLLEHQHTMSTQDFIQVEFTGRQRLSEEERRVIKEAGVSFRGRNAWPQFMRFRPGMYPREINLEELRILLFALQQAAEVVRDSRLEEVLPLPVLDLEESSYSIHVRTAAGASGETAPGRYTRETFSLEPPSTGDDEEAPIDELRLNRIRRAGLTLQGQWEVHTGYVMMPMEADPESGYDEPFLPHIQSIMDRESGMALHVMVSPPNQATANLQTAVMDKIEELGVMPEAVVVLSEEAKAAMMPLCRILDTPLLVEDSLGQTENMIAHFLDSLEA